MYYVVSVIQVARVLAMARPWLSPDRRPTGSVATISMLKEVGRSGGPMSNSVRACAARLALGGMNGPRPVPAAADGIVVEDEDAEDVSVTWAFGRAVEDVDSRVRPA